MNGKLAACIAMLALAACGDRSSTGTLKQTEPQPAAAALAPNEEVVILNGAGWGSEGGGPAQCVRDAVHRANPTIRFHDGDGFRTALYPWFEPGIAPGTEEQLSNLFKQPLVQRKAATLGVRYVVMMTGGTYTSDAAVSVFPGGAPLAGGSAHKSISFQAKVWDIKEIRSAGSISASASGTNVIMVIPPIPIMGATEREVCDDIGRRLAAYFTGG